MLPATWRGPEIALGAFAMIGQYLYLFGGCDWEGVTNTLFRLDLDSFNWLVHEVPNFKFYGALVAVRGKQNII